MPVANGSATELPLRSDGCAWCDVVSILDFFGGNTIRRVIVKRRFVSLTFRDSPPRCRQLNYTVTIIHGWGIPTFADIANGGIIEYDYTAFSWCGSFNWSGCGYNITPKQTLTLRVAQKKITATRNINGPESLKRIIKVVIICREYQNERRGP